MGTFQDREKGFERKYELDQERQFQIQARRDRLFGHWIAGKLGLVAAAADAYAKDVVGSNFERPGDEDMLDKVKKDLKARSIAVSDSELIKKLSDLQTMATQEVMGTQK